MNILILMWLVLIVIVVVILGSYTVLTYVYSKKKLPIYKNKIYPSVSLIIPFYNEEIVLKKKIENTSKLTYPKNKLEIIFLNDHSTDNSIKIIKKEAKKLKFKWKIVNSFGNKGKANALNYIFSKINKEVTIMTDSDSLIKEDALSIIVQNFQNKDVGGANGKLNIISYKGNKSYEEESLYRRFYDIWRLGESNFYSITICNGPLMAIRTSLLKRLKLNIRNKNSADDTELALLIANENYRMVYDNKAIVYEVTPPNYFERLRQKMRRAKGVIDAYLNNASLFGKNKFGNVLYPYNLLLYIIVPYLVSLAVILYIILIFIKPLLLTLLILLLIPGIRKGVLSFITTEILVALSPFFSRSWSTSSSSREVFRK